MRFHEQPPHRHPPVHTGRRHRRRGNYAILVGLAATGVLTMGSVAVDSAYIHLVEAKTQAISDSAAHAALVTLKLTRDIDDARKTAKAFVNAHELVGKTADVDGSTDIVFGSWDFETQEFDDSSAYVNSVRVTVRKTDDSVNGSFSTLLMRMFGSTHSTAEASSPAIGALRYRQIVVVQDVTDSFKEEIDRARDANLAFLQAVYGDGYPGDQLGMVTFVGGATEYTGLEYVADQYSSIQTDWSNLDYCDRSYYPYNYYGPPAYHAAPQMMACNYGSTYYVSSFDSGTSQGAGIYEAVDMLKAAGDDYSYKIIVLISDGLPECVYKATEAAAEADCSAKRELDAEEAADWAEDNGISIFSVSYNETYDAQQSALMEDLVRGHGSFYETPDADELTDILEDIATQIPIALVQ